MFRFRRKDGESQMVFNQRSAKKVLEWFQHSKVRMAHHRVLKAIFLASWHEKRPAIGLRQHCLQLARECRTRAWWESLQASSTQSGRKAEGLVRARAGHPTTAWEDVFVQVFGAHWRAERDSCASRRDWMCHCDDFINQVCDFWNLPKLPHSNRHCAFHDTGRAANSVVGTIFRFCRTTRWIRNSYPVGGDFGYRLIAKGLLISPRDVPFYKQRSSTQHLFGYQETSCVCTPWVGSPCMMGWNLCFGRLANTTLSLTTAATCPWTTKKISVRKMLHHYKTHSSRDTTCAFAWMAV